VAAVPIHPSPDSSPFWSACRERRLVLPRCTACGDLFFYPRTLCPVCGSRDLTWVEVSGRGRIHAFTIQHVTAVPELRDVLPFVTVLVELDEGPRMMSFLVDAGADPSSIRCDAPVEVDFRDDPSGQPFPVFRYRR
jgi:uncharacterized OB-fold protein